MKKIKSNNAKDALKELEKFSKDVKNIEFDFAFLSAALLKMKHINAEKFEVKYHNSKNVKGRCLTLTLENQDICKECNEGEE